MIGEKLKTALFYHNMTQKTGAESRRDRSDNVSLLQKRKRSEA